MVTGEVDVKKFTPSPLISDIARTVGDMTQKQKQVSMVPKDDIGNPFDCTSNIQLLN
ncbi:hypothetical protein CCP3SC5AM1_700007 [Gammaproteobacteria bacterium]